MGKTEEGGRDRVVLDYPSHLLRTLFSQKCLSGKEDMELSLGLSSNGGFGDEPKDSKLAGSSSIPGLNGGNEDGEAAVPNGFASPSSLARACTLPVEMAEEWRKRKEMQSLRRMDAKRKRSEREESLKGVRDQTGGNGGGDGNSNGFSGMGIWGLDRDSAGAGGGFGGNRSVEFPHLPPSSKASAASPGSGPSAIPEADNKLQLIIGNNPSGKALNPASDQPSPESVQKHLVIPKKEREEEMSGVGQGSLNMANNPSGKALNPASDQPLPESEKKPLVIPKKEQEGEMSGVGQGGLNMAKELVKNADMPSVSTTGEGPNGKRIEGFLYRYRKVEELTIVCVCHGQFFSPAEFIRHAGGREVANPLKHIMVSPTPKK